MRRARALLLALVAVALVGQAAASAAFVPIDRGSGEAEQPRVRPGTIEPRSTTAGEPRVRVLLRLRSAPLAAWAPRLPAAAGEPRRLDLASASARAHLDALATEQAAAERALLAAVPGARLEGRYSLLLNAIGASVPAHAFATAARVEGVTRAYPSRSYVLTLDRSPGVIGIDATWQATGALGDGIKIAIVDDGVDEDNPFLAPGGLTAPAGFPRGVRSATTGKVIVARSFPAPGAGDAARLPYDPDSSFHGTHVAGIAAGAAGTTAPKGDDHPRTAGLSGIAPRAWLGNYRVFSLPTEGGNVANTPEIVQAFESAVRDGMDVINFSGGGVETEPENDALVEATGNATRAGVTVVISAGNDRDDYGQGSIGSPGSAPDAISVAAVGSGHVFAPAIALRADDAPAGLQAIPYASDGGSGPPRAWVAADQRLVDVSTLVGRDGSPVSRALCAPTGDPNGPGSPLAKGALKGAIALVSRGTCTFASKARRVEAAGGIGLVVVDNRPGEANGIADELDVPAVMIADADGAALSAYLAAHGGTAAIRVGREPLELVTGREGVLTSFSSQGPTAYAHSLKPDLAAPGGAILSSTNRALTRSPYAVFDGTSMAAPHVAGAAALLLQRHPDWTPWQVKSALVSTAGPAWADSARTVEASVTLAGGGLVDVPAAADPRVATRPATLSFGDLDVQAGAAAETRLLTVADLGGGAGSWTIEARPQTAPAGTVLELPAAVDVPAGGQATIVVTARAAADAAEGDASGFLVLRQGTVERRIPYLALVTRPALAALDAIPLQPGTFRSGTTRGTSRVDGYRFPLAPLGLAPDYVGQALVESGRETLYTILVDRPALNAGVALDATAPGSQVDPFMLRAPDESTVLGYAATPAILNGLLNGFRVPGAAAGISFPRAGRYYAVVDSARDLFTGKDLRGRFVVHSWLDDVTRPSVRLLTPRIARGGGVVAVRVLDFGSGPDPLSLLLSYGDVLVGASSYDPLTNVALFQLPADSPLFAGENAVTILASDHQEGKNVNIIGLDQYPNTTITTRDVRVTPGRLVLNWLSPAPGPGLCLPRGRVDLLVLADGPARVRSVRFRLAGKAIGTDRAGDGGVFRAAWRARGPAGATRTLVAVATDARGRTTTSRSTIRLCS
ncbi:MAG: S8 family serine peptidase [Thermoleophilia bacterium]